MKIPQATFFQKSVSFNSRKESRKLYLHYQNSIRKYEYEDFLEY